MVTLRPFAEEPFRNFCVNKEIIIKLKENKQENLIKSLNEE